MELLSGSAQEILVKAESEKSESVKTCTCCGKAKSLRSFHKNRSKALGVESACKVCVRKQKKKIRQKAKRKRLSTISFTSAVVGELGEDTEKSFVESYSEIIRDLHYDKKI
jgi:formate dehydrogenase assembly factor FdhD